MKIGTKYQSEIKPDTGFNIRREGYSIYLQYIPEDSITTVFVPESGSESDTKIKGHTEYMYSLYCCSNAITTYEELVSKLISLKYTIEDEIGLTNKRIAGESADYDKYRAYVDECKAIAKEKYVELALIKNEE